MNDNNGIKFCTFEQLDHEACLGYLSWLTQGAGDRTSDLSVEWLLAHCYDGVTWGRLGEDHSWQVSSMVFPDLCPCISASNLLELRLFGQEREILIWRTEGGFFGRSLKDQLVLEKTDPCRPDNETRILMGNKYRELKEGFTLIATARGMQQAVPLECTVDHFSGNRWPLRLTVRHYFEEDKKTGAVRIGASRLVNVFKKGV